MVEEVSSLLAPPASTPQPDNENPTTARPAAETIKTPKKAKKKVKEAPNADEPSAADAPDSADSADATTKKARKRKRKQKKIPFGRHAVHKVDEVKLHVCNLPYSTSHNHLGALFSPFGEVLEVFVLKRPDARNNNSRAAFVRMSPAEAGEEAMRKLDGIEWKGSVLRVRLSIHNKDRTHYMQTVGEVPTVGDTCILPVDKTKSTKSSKTISEAATSSTSGSRTPLNQGSIGPRSPSTEFGYPTPSDGEEAYEASFKSSDDDDSDDAGDINNVWTTANPWSLDRNEAAYLAAVRGKYRSAQLRSSTTTFATADLFVRIRVGSELKK